MQLNLEGKQMSVQPILVQLNLQEKCLILRMGDCFSSSILQISL